MKTVTRFTTFADLKASEKKVKSNKLQLKKHNDFEKVIKEIYAARVHKTDNEQSE